MTGGEKGLGMTNRTEDSAVVIKREIPLWGMISTIGVIVLQAALILQAMRDQAGELRSAQLVQAAEMKNIAAQLNGVQDGIRQASAYKAAAELADAKHDLSIEELRRRVSALEGRAR